MHSDVQREFGRRLSAGERLLGTFLKTASPHATEILGEVGFDFVVVDAEHAPFGPGDIDVMMLAARAAGIASLVRVPSADPAPILSVLDCGASGILVPHIASAEVLRGVVAAARYRGGSRGFSNSPRAGRYGSLGFAEHMDVSDRSVSILAMIEDPAALDRLDDIFAVEGLTGAFIGRGDLTASLGAASPRDPAVIDAVTRIAGAARRHRVALLAHVGSAADPDMSELAEAGVTAFIVSSDQGLLRRSASEQRKAFDA